MVCRGWLGLLSLLGVLLAMSGCGGRTLEAWDGYGVAGAIPGAGNGSGGSTGGSGGGLPVAGATPAGGAGTGGSGIAGAGPWLARGDSELVDLFVGKLGIYAVLHDGIELRRRSDGAVLNQVPTKGTVISAAFDGEYLSVGTSSGLLVTYTLDLNSQFITQLMTPCTGLALVSAHRAVCGSLIPQAGYRLFQVYDSLGGALLDAGALPNTGTQLRRIPATDDFIAFSEPFADGTQVLTAYRVHDSSRFELIGSVGLQADFGIFAFDARVPQALLMTSDGQVLDIYDTSCGFAVCLTQGRSFQRLPSTQRYLGFDTVTPGRTIALVDPDIDVPLDSQPKTILLQSLDLFSRVLRSTQITSAELGTVIAFRRDELGSTVLVGYRSPAPGSAPGHSIVQIPYRE